MNNIVPDLLFKCYSNKYVDNYLPMQDFKMTLSWFMEDCHLDQNVINSDILIP